MSGGIQVEMSKKGVKLNLRKKRLYTELQIEESVAWDGGRGKRTKWEEEGSAEHTPWRTPKSEGGASTTREGE